MPITITTLKDSGENNRVFTKIGSDRYASEWLNTEQSTAEYDSRLYVKQSVITQKNGIKLRRCLVQVVHKKPGVAPNGKAYEEMAVANFTFTCPLLITELSLTEVYNAMTFARSLVTVPVMEQLIRGEV